MAGDVAAVAILLTKLLGYAVDPEGYESWSRETKLARLMEAINAAIRAHDEASVAIVFGEYRWVLQQAGP